MLRNAGRSLAAGPRLTGRPNICATSSSTPFRGVVTVTKTPVFPSAEHVPLVGATSKGKFRRSNADQERKASSNDEKEVDQAQPRRTVMEPFSNLGLSKQLSQRVHEVFPHIREPTHAQQAILQLSGQACDFILRSHTGTGKSFAMLLALLAKPRVVIESGKGDSLKHQNTISSIIVVPSSELAEQYMSWARALWPDSMMASLPSVVTCMHRDQDATVDEQLKQLRETNPHVLVVSATKLQEFLERPSGPAVLGISTMRTLVLDEADALLDLPPRFPSQKALWRHQRHPPAGLKALNQIMAMRATYSGGLPIPRAGLEGDRIKESIRRVQHQGADELYQRSQDKKGKGIQLSEAKPRLQGETPLQLVALSATANSVLRNFLGARTGWLRTNVRSEGEQRRRIGGAGKWVDMTGLSKNEVQREQGIEYPKAGPWPLQVPRQIAHSCVVVDEPSLDASKDTELSKISELSIWRNLNPGEVRKGKDEETEEEEDSTEFSKVEAAEEESEETEKSTQKKKGRTTIVKPVPSATGQIDVSLLETLAYLFAIRNVQRGLALVSPQWSLRAVVEQLQSLGVPATSSIRPLPTVTASVLGEEDHQLVVMSASLVRGIDLPNLDHVFLVGPGSCMDIDTVSYVHDAGRVARIGQTGEVASDESVFTGAEATRKTGSVISIVKGVDPSKQHSGSDRVERSSAELKMALIFKRLNVKCVQIHLPVPEVVAEEAMAAMEAGPEDEFSSAEGVSASKEGSIVNEVVSDKNKGDVEGKHLFSQEAVDTKKGDAVTDEIQNQDIATKDGIKAQKAETT